jgi:hypothetical protein
MRLLLPEIDRLLEFHLALGIECISDIQILDISVSLKLLSELSLDVCQRDIDFVHLPNFLSLFVSIKLWQ